MSEPVRHIRHVDGKWRIMNKDGSSILHAGNKKGNAAADGGGFSTYAEALKFFQAMESHMHG